MELHTATLDETLSGKDSENLKALITLDFTRVCDVEISTAIPAIAETDIDVVSDLVKNVILYECIKSTTLTKLLKDIHNIIQHELYLLIDKHKISIPDSDIVFSKGFNILLVETFNKTKHIMSKYNLIPNYYKDIVAVANTYNHEKNRHYITIGVYESE